MAGDNVQVTPGSGEVIAADEVTRNAVVEKQQIIKIAIGDDGAYEGVVGNTRGLPVEGLDFGNTPRRLRTDTNGRMKISHGQPVPVTGTLNVLAAQVAVSSDGFSDVIFYFSGTTVQTVTFEQSPDSTDGITGLWFPVLATNQAAVAAAATTAAITTTATYRVSAPAGAWIRVRTSAFTSGSSAVQAVTTSAMAQAQVNTVPSGTQAVSGTVTSNLGTGGVTATSIGKAEDAVHVTGDTGVAVWGVRYEAMTAPVSAAGDYGFVQVDDLGKGVVMPYAPPINQLQGITTAMTVTTSTAIIAAQAVGVRIYVTGLTVTNTSAVATEIQILDGAVILDRVFSPANSTVPINYNTPLKGTAATALNALNVTTGSNTYVSARGFKAL